MASIRSGIRLAGSRLVTWESIHLQADKIAQLLDENALYLIDPIDMVHATVALAAMIKNGHASFIWASKQHFEKYTLNEVAPCIYTGLPEITKEHPSGPYYGSMTSGSTGQAKCPMASVKHLKKIALSYARLLYHHTDETLASQRVIMTNLPLEYSAVLMMVVLPAFFAELTVEWIAPQQTGDAIEQEKSASITLVTAPCMLTVFEAWTSTKMSFHNLQIITTAGLLTGEIAFRTRAKCAGVTLRSSYGCSEAGVVTLSEAQSINYNVGKVIATKNVKLLNPDADGIGQIAIEGEEIRDFYYNTDEPVNKRGNYFISQDMGRLNQLGELHLHGRKDKALKLNGRLVYPGTLVSECLGIKGVIDATYTVVERKALATPKLILKLVVVEKTVGVEGDVKRLLKELDMVSVEYFKRDEVMYTERGKLCLL